MTSGGRSAGENLFEGDKGEQDRLFPSDLTGDRLCDRQFEKGRRQHTAGIPAQAADDAKVIGTVCGMIVMFVVRGVFQRGGAAGGLPDNGLTGVQRRQDAGKERQVGSEEHPEHDVILRSIDLDGLANAAQYHEYQIQPG